MSIRLVLAAAVLLATIAVGVANPAPVAALSCGPCPATTTDAVNMREGPSTGEDVIRVIRRGREISWDPEVGESNGYVLATFDGSEGWVHADYLLLFMQGAKTTDAVALRSSNRRSAPALLVIPRSANVTVLSGPRNGFFSVSYNSQQGWVHAGYLALSDPAVGLVPGSPAVVDTDLLNMRATAGLSGRIITQLPGGTRLIVAAGPKTVDGRAWFLVGAGTRPGPGWVAAEYVRRA